MNSWKFGTRYVNIKCAGREMLTSTHLYTEHSSAVRYDAEIYA